MSVRPIDPNWPSAGEWLAYSVSATTTADYTLEARVASSGPGGRFHVEVDGEEMVEYRSDPGGIVYLAGVPQGAGVRLGFAPVT